MSRRFPIDCPLDCEFHKMWDLSVDDYTHVCVKNLVNRWMNVIMGMECFCYALWKVRDKE